MVIGRFSSISGPRPDDGFRGSIRTVGILVRLTHPADARNLDSPALDDGRRSIGNPATASRLLPLGRGGPAIYFGGSRQILVPGADRGSQEYALGELSVNAERQTYDQRLCRSGNDFSRASGLPEVLHSIDRNPTPKATGQRALTIRNVPWGGADRRLRLRALWESLHLPRRSEPGRPASQQPGNR